VIIDGALVYYGNISVLYSGRTVLGLSESSKNGL
jgi:hypothetical protein